MVMGTLVPPPKRQHTYRGIKQIKSTFVEGGFYHTLALIGLSVTANILTGVSPLYSKEGLGSTTTKY
jgi:hypothetical protein